MLHYKRVGDMVTPYWYNKKTKRDEVLTFSQVVDGGDVPGANKPFLVDGVSCSYSRLGWVPFYIQSVGHYTNPRLLKPNGFRITDADFFYQD